MRHCLRQRTVRPHVSAGHAGGAKAVHEAEHLEHQAWDRGNEIALLRLGDKAEVPGKQGAADQQIVINQLLQQARTGR